MTVYTDSSTVTCTTTPASSQTAQLVDSNEVNIATIVTADQFSETLDAVTTASKAIISALDHICTVTPLLVGVMQERWSGAEEVKWLGELVGERWSGTLVEGQIQNPC